MSGGTSSTSNDLLNSIENQGFSIITKIENNDNLIENPIHNNEEGILFSGVSIEEILGLNKEMNT